MKTLDVCHCMHGRLGEGMIMATRDIYIVYGSYSWLQVKRGTKHIQVQLHYLQQVALYCLQWNIQFWQWLPPHGMNHHSTNVV